MSAEKGFVRLVLSFPEMILIPDFRKSHGRARLATQLARMDPVST